MTGKKTIDKSLIQKTIVFAFWLVIILICLINRDKITVDAIVNFTPGNKWAAVLVIWLLFAFKSITVVVYGGPIYAASGIMFSLPVAIIVNTVGTALMVSIPFFIGKKAGNGTINKIVEKNPKLEVLRSVPNKNELFISFFVRLLGILPSDLVSMYLGASGINYGKYILGSLIGLFPAVISFSVMGMSANDVTSPEFIISAAFEIGLMIFSIVMYFVWRRKSKRTNKNPEGKNAEKTNQHTGNA